jgi:hypothetical protein
MPRHTGVVTTLTILRHRPRKSFGGDARAARHHACTVRRERDRVLLREAEACAPMS